jgi:hypothetical protein
MLLVTYHRESANDHDEHPAEKRYGVDTEEGVSGDGLFVSGGVAVSEQNVVEAVASYKGCLCGVGVAAVRVRSPPCRVAYSALGADNLHLLSVLFVCIDRVHLRVDGRRQRYSNCNAPGVMMRSRLRSHGLQ